GQLERAAADRDAAVVDRRAALEGGARRGTVAEGDAVGRHLRVDFGDAARARGALVADVVGEPLAVLVAAAVHDSRVVSTAQRHRRPSAREAAAAPVVERRVVALEDARGVVDTGAAVTAAVL